MEEVKRERGTGSVFHNGSNIWWIKYYWRGVPRRESSHSTDRKVAERLLKRKLAEVLTKTYTPRTNVKVDELIVDVLAEYKREGRKTTKDVKLRWKNHLEPFFTRLRADDLNSDHVQRYCAKREAEGACGPTINRELSVLKHAFHLALKCTPPKVRSCPVMPMYKESDPRTGFLEDKQYVRLARECDKVGLWLRALLAIGYNFAFRRGELLAMRVQQVDLLNLTIRLEAGTTKNGKPRIIKMVKDSELATLLTACVMGKQPTDHVFTRDKGRNGKPLPKGKPVRVFRRSWASVCKRAGVAGIPGSPDLLFHDLRRSGVRNLIRSGVQQSVAKKISGHRTDSVFERYNIIDEADLAEAARKLDERQKSNAREFSDFGHDSGIVVENSTKTEAVAHLNSTTAVLPN